MNELYEKVELILGPKEQLTTWGIEKKSRGDLVVVENQRMDDQLELALKEGQNANFFKIAAHFMYNELL